MWSDTRKNYFSRTKNLLYNRQLDHIDTIYIAYRSHDVYIARVSLYLQWAAVGPSLGHVVAVEVHTLLLDMLVVV